MSLIDIFDDSDLIYYVGSDLKSGSLRSPHAAPSGAVFYSINPLDPNWEARAATQTKPPATPRFSLNVSKFRNFVYESDSMALDEQLTEWLKLANDLPIKKLTYSGGKSYHAVISVIDELGFEPHTEAGVAAYKQAWKGLKGFIEANSKLKLDPSTKDPSRLSRLPGALRGPGTEQCAVQIHSRYASAAEIMEIMAQYAPVSSFSQAPVSGSPASFTSLELALKNQMSLKPLAYEVFNAHTWASAENMYPELFRLTLWAIDRINPSPEAWTQVLQTHVFPKIKAVGYKRDLLLPVRNAYAYKGLPFP